MQILHQDSQAPPSPLTSLCVVTATIPATPTPRGAYDSDGGGPTSRTITYSNATTATEATHCSQDEHVHQNALDLCCVVFILVVHQRLQFVCFLVVVAIMFADNYCPHSSSMSVT